MTRLSRRALLLASGALAASRTARADAVDDVLARVTRARSAVRTIQGPFVQTLVRPDRLRWDLSPPDDVTFWIGPGGLAYRSAHGQASLPNASARIAGALDDLRTLLGGDPARLRPRWNLAVVRDDAAGVDLDATPLGGAPPLRGLRFSLAPDLVRPTRAVLVEGPRDRTVIEFGALVLDAPVDDAKMRPPR
jgi:hypothetical protein